VLQAEAPRDKGWLCMFITLEHTVVGYAAISRSVTAYCLAGVSSAWVCEMMGCVLSLTRLGNLMVFFLPLKSEQVSVIFSEEYLQGKVLSVRG